MEADWDVKITLSGTTRKLKLLQTREGKAWTVRELPPPATPSEAQASREGSSINKLPFHMEDWSWGAGLQRFGNRDLPGHKFRLDDGFGIDLSDPGFIKHGPVGTTVGTFNSAAEQAIMFLNKVWFITNTRVYNYDGTSLTQFEDMFVTQAINDIIDIVTFGSNIFVSTSDGGGKKYWKSNGTAAFAEVKNVAASLPTDFFQIVGQNIWRAYNPSSTAPTLIQRNDDPTDGTGWEPAGGIQIGFAEGINSLFTLSGLLFVGTQSSIYVVNSEDEPIEFNSKMQTRRGARANAVVSNIGTDAWISDEIDIDRILPIDFEAFDIRPAGPFFGFDPVPYTSSTKLSITSIAQDMDFVYVCVDDGASTFVYKGKEVERGLFVWSPLVKVTGTNNFAGVFKLTGDSTPFLYIGAALTVVKYALPWTTYAASWEAITPQFTAGVEEWDKMWHTLRCYVENSGTANAKVTVYYRLDNNTSWTLFGSTGELTADGLNSIALTAPITGKKVQLRFVGSTTNSGKRVNIRSFDLRGMVRPPHALTYDFTVVVDNKGDSDFIYSLRTNTSAFITVEDRFGTAKTVFVHPGYPIEQEMYDELFKRPTRAYNIVAEEVV